MPIPSAIRLKAELPVDLAGVRRLLLAAAPKLERRQPGITEQFRLMDLRLPLQLLAPSGESLTVVFEAGPTSTSVKVEVRPPGLPMNALKARWWRWWTRFKVKSMLKMAKTTAHRQQVRDLGAGADGVIRPEVMPPER